MTTPTGPTHVERWQTEACDIAILPTTPRSRAGAFTAATTRLPLAARRAVYASAAATVQPRNAAF